MFRDLSLHFQRAAGVLLLGALLAACALPGQAAGDPPSPTPVATAPVLTPVTVQPTQPATAVQPAPPTTVTMPTPIPTAAGTMPTVAPKPTVAGGQPVPAQPIIGFNPKGGPAGTRVELFGSGYTPGQAVVVRLGLPSATGEVLASAWAGNDGRWSANLVIPDRLPSGEVITSSEMYLVAMNDRNQALASARFGFVPPVATPGKDAGFDMVFNMLGTWQRGGDVRPFLGARLRAQADAGVPADQLTRLHPIALKGYWGDTRWDGPDGTNIVSFYLDYGTFVELRSFGLAAEGGQWRLIGTALDLPQPSPILPANETQAVDLFLHAAKSDRRMKNASFYLTAVLRNQVRQDQIVDVGALLMEQNPYQSYSVDRVISSNADTSLVQATLYYGAGPGYGRIFELNRRDGGFWRIVNITIPTTPPTAVPPTAVPPTAVPPTAVPPTTVPPTLAPYPAP
jgi:hypothetical protein